MKLILPKLLFATLLVMSVTGLAAQDSIGAAEAVTSAEVKTLISAYEREKERVLATLDLNFDKALNDLKVFYTQAGNLNGVLAVDALIKARPGDQGVKKAESEPKEDKSSRWKWGTGGELTINADGTATHSSWKRSGIWEKLPDGTLELLSETGLHKIEFLADGSAIVTGRTRDTTLTPIE